MRPGPSEAAVTLLPDGRVLAVYRVEEHENLWQSLSSDGGGTHGESAAVGSGSGREAGLGGRNHKCEDDQIFQSHVALLFPLQH